MKVVSVIKNNYTPRDKLIPERFNIILNFIVSVNQNSYLFSGSFPAPSKIPENINKEFERMVNSARRGNINLDGIRRLCNKLRYEWRKTAPPKIFPKLAGKHVIPGSSIKGAVRSRVEYKLAPFEEENGIRSYSCYISYDPKAMPGERHLNFWGEDVTLPREVCEPPLVCAVCDLFGSRNLSSRVFFSDAIMLQGGVEKLADLGIEAVKPGSKFNLAVTMQNANLLDLGLLFLGLELFTSSPILLGFYKYRFNKKAGGTPYRGKYYFGLLDVSLDSFSFPSIQYVPLPENIRGAKEPSALIKMARSELEHKIGNFVKIEEGLVK